MRKVKIMKNQKGFTLLEVILSFALLGIIASITFSFLYASVDISSKTKEEYDVQSEIRLLSQKVDTIVKDSSATFALYRVDNDDLTPGWNYIIPIMDNPPMPDYSSIIEYKWNGTDHDPNVIAAKQEGVTYKLEFSKLNASNVDNLLQYKIIATVNGQTREIQSEAEALNSLQVIDKGSLSHPANTLAYRVDPRPNEVSDVQAAVAMVLDQSGSMDYNMNGGSSSYANSRMKKMKDEAIRLIQGLSTNPNIYVSIVPFSDTANGAQPMRHAWVNDTAYNVLIDQITAMDADGGTNTGDGMRRGYYAIKEYNDTATKTVNNFMIILVDGETTFFSAHKVNGSIWSGISSIEYVMGNSNIENRQIDLSSLFFNDYGTRFINGRYAGNGSHLDTHGTAYVDEIGEMIRDYGVYTETDKEPIKVYVIGFSNDPHDYGSLGDIAYATSLSHTYYTAGDSATLEGIFANIQKDINDSLWHIGGPN